MLIDELIPEISRKYKISNNSDARVIGGASSGAICAWTVAWNDPINFAR